MSRASLTLLLYNRNVTKTLTLLAILAFVLLTSSHTAFVQAPAVAPAPASGAPSGLLASLGGLTKMIIDFIIGLGGLILGISVAMGAFSGQVASAMGMPYAQASAGQRVITAIGLFALTAASILIANTVIDQVGKLTAGSGSIHFIH